VRLTSPSSAYSAGCETATSSGIAGQSFQSRSSE
jgi:hypothetical protein